MPAILALSRRGCIITMADRYQDRLFSTDTAHKAESDPLAELARLIGQTDPFGSANKPPPRPLSRANARPQQYEPQADEDDTPPAGPPPWMQRARQETVVPPPVQRTEYEEPEPDYQPKPVHPLHRYAAQQAQPLAPEPVTTYRPVEPPLDNPRPLTTSRPTRAATRAMIRRATTMRSTASWKPANRICSAIHPIRMIPMPTRPTRKNPNRAAGVAA
ncbi:hypothetical protein ACVILK_000545 [Bradyrhizobium embrapense]